jgi:predicted O-methyltransferase YrrM
VGITPVAPATGAALQWLGRLIGARAVAEIGTGAGVSGLWLLRGMTDDGILTSVDGDAESTRAARRAFTDAGIPTQRVRLITGEALDVLSRLADGAYDLVFLDGDAREYDRYLDEALRLLRPGGLVIFEHALVDDKVPDPAQRDAVTVAVRSLVSAARDDERIRPLLLPVGDGLLVAQKQAAKSAEEQDQADPGPGPDRNPAAPSATATTSNGS